MNLHWNKCKGDVWCKLSTVNLSHDHFDSKNGVYIIWHGGPNAKTVRIGQGVIKDRLAAHRIDPDVQAYSGHTLYVTWAFVSDASRNGVEAFLAQRLKPLVGERFQNVPSIEVNLPW
jgi:hypothetical protein